MDCYYAQVEMKRHGVPDDQPLGVLQWRSLIAVNYAAKSQGVRRGMTAYEALAACPRCMFAHVATLGLDEHGHEKQYPSTIVKVVSLKPRIEGDQEFK